MKTKPFDLESAMNDTIIVCGKCKGHYMFSLNHPNKHLSAPLHVFKMVDQDGLEFIATITDEGRIFYSSFPAIDEIEVESICIEKEYWIATGKALSGAMFTSSPATTESGALGNLNYFHSTAIVNNSIQTHKIIRYE